MKVKYTKTCKIQRVNRTSCKEYLNTMYKGQSQTHINGLQLLID